MKLLRRVLIATALCVTTMVAVYAQERSKAEVKIGEMVKQFEASSGVQCITVAKGSGLGLVKAMFNQQFGKEFMKGVTSITIINYSDASAETCAALRKEIESLGEILMDFKMGENKEFSGYSYAKSLANLQGDGSISDFVTALEDKETKMLMYMSGKIAVK